LFQNVADKVRRRTTNLKLPRRADLAVLLHRPLCATNLPLEMLVRPSLALATG